jgi:hypothetical protein
MSLAAVIVDSRPIDENIIKQHLKHLPSDTRLYIFTPNIRSIWEYNNLLCSKEFWKGIKEENILIFQQDSMLLRSGIEEFYEYDYVGASWNFEPYVGNGGLSFRKKSAMLKIINTFNYNGLVNEDIYFANGCKMLGLKLAPIELANKFSCETQFHLGTLGYHAIEKYLTNEQINKIKNQYNG